MRDEFRTSPRVDREAERDAAKMEADRELLARVAERRERNRPGSHQALTICEQWERDFQMSSHMAYGLLTTDPHTPRAWDGAGPLMATETRANRVRLIEQLQRRALPWMKAYCFLVNRELPPGMERSDEPVSVLPRSDH